MCDQCFQYLGLVNYRHIYIVRPKPLLRPPLKHVCRDSEGGRFVSVSIRAGIFALGKEKPLQVVCHRSEHPRKDIVFLVRNVVCP